MARILIAEDEEALRALTARALTDSGHEVVTAVDGADALDILTREKRAFRAAADRHQDAADGRHCARARDRARPSGDHHPADDGLCGPARARLEPRRADPRRDPEAVHARRDQGGGERRAGRSGTRSRSSACEGIRAVRTAPPGLRHGRLRRAAAASGLERDRIKNPSAAARCSRARAAAAPDRRSACAALPGCGARAARRSRPAPSR